MNATEKTIRLEAKIYSKSNLKISENFRPVQGVI